MNSRFAPFLALFLVFGILKAQDSETLRGTISFVTSNNVYVKLDTTEPIKIGTSLSLNGQECLKVTDKSSTSLVCTIVNDCAPKVGDEVSYSYIPEVIIEKEETPTPEESNIEEETKDTSVIETEGSSPPLYSENIRGRITLSNYNTISDLRENRNRFRTRFSMSANHIGDSKFSVQTHVAYRAISNAPANGRDNILNVYNLNLRYDVMKDLSITGGRFINPKASSLGPVDGVLVEKYFNKFYVGAMGGFRPDLEDFGFNSDLLQYGGYVGIETGERDFISQTTLGAMEQTNAGATDRRYLYFQHNSTIASNLNLFSSAELDIFSTAGDKTRLTNLYLSTRYRFSRAANLMVSYDTRKRIIYYESYDSILDRLLDDDLARQGLRARLNVRPHKIIWAGISYSKRFQSNDENKSDNVYLYASVSRIPKIGGRFNVSFNNNNSNYLKSTIYAVRYSRELFDSKLNADIYYRNANYSYENYNLEDTNIHYFGATLAYHISRTWQLSLSGELATYELENTYRFYTRLTKRFSSKKKK